MNVKTLISHKTLFLSIVILGVFVFLLVSSILDKSRMTSFFAKGSYYIISAMFFLWIARTAFLWKARDFSLLAFLKQNTPGTILAALLTGIIFVSVDVGFKTLSDETNLLAVSKAMVSEKTVYNLTSAKYYYGNLNPINREIPTRPLLFPYLTHLLHLITDYNYRNPFILNALTLFLFLAGIYVVARRFTDHFSAAAAMVLVVTYPVMSIYGTSGGFDLCSTFFFFLGFAGLFVFIKDNDPNSFGFTWMTFLLLANIRYESIIFLPLVFGLLFCLRYIKWDELRENMLTLAATPLMLLPLAWQFILTWGKHNEHPDHIPLFTLQKFGENAKILGSSIFDFAYFLPYAGAVTLASFIGIFYLIYRRMIKKDKKISLSMSESTRHFAIIFCSVLCISTAIFLAHYGGTMNHPTQARFFLIFVVVLSLLPILIKIISPEIISGRALLFFAVFAFIIYHPAAVEGRFINTLVLIREFRQTTEYVRRLESPNILVVSDRPGQFVALNYGSVNFEHANKNAARLMSELKKRLFSDIVVIQRISYLTKDPEKEYVLDKAFELEVSKEFQITANEFVRISKVKF